MVAIVKGRVPPSVVRLLASEPVRRYWPLLAAFLAMYVPTVARLSTGPWQTAHDGHGPVILAAAIWLAYSRLKDFDFSASMPRPLIGGVMLAPALLFYAVGRSQEMLFVEAGSLIPLFMGLILIFHGQRLLRWLWFVLVFLIFALPLPGWFTADLTQPLKQAASALATDWLYLLGYPVSHNGVIIDMGQYQLLVQDACAGLNSMFSLSAVGLFYIDLVAHRCVWHKMALALCILPASFFANLVRILILLLVCYHFGDAAAQGFVHDFSGVILFIAALAAILFLDGFFVAAQKLWVGRRRTRVESAS